jgi:hypothetical protein
MAGTAGLGGAWHGRQGAAGRGLAWHGTAWFFNFTFTGVFKMDINWSAGSRFKTDAAVAHKEVERIRIKNGGDIDAEQIVQAAESKRNPLHKEFEWDDALAAHQHRLEVGRLLLRSLVVVRDDISTDRPQRVYHHISTPATKTEETKRVYRTAEDVLADPDTRADLLRRALKELISFRDRFRDLQELAIVMRQIDTLVETVQV